MLAMFSLAVGLSASPASAAPPGPCDLLDKATASQLLGKPVASMEPSGPEPDEDSGGMRTHCVYMAGTSMLVVTQVIFQSPAAASETTTRELVGERYGEDEDMTVEEAGGLGDKAFWAYTPTAADYIVVKGAKVLALTLGGTGKDPKSYQASLREATAAVLKKL
jgi:hypothetical protein